MRIAREEPELVWYASYGANMARDRFSCYLSGGTPAGGSRANPGCRDPRPPRDERAVWLAGGVYFALRSPMWGGGLALYDPALPGAVPARAYLLTADQFADVAAQEMYRPPGAELDLAGVVGAGRRVLGEGRYETVVHAGEIDGVAVLTFTAHWARSAVEPAPPSAAYLRVIGSGVLDTHDWDARRAAGYLTGCGGARGAWDAGEVAALLEGARPGPHAGGDNRSSRAGASSRE